MKLYVLNRLVKFQDIYKSNKYLNKVLSESNSNVYFIETDDLSEIRRLLTLNRIKYKIE